MGCGASDLHTAVLEEDLSAVRGALKDSDVTTSQIEARNPEGRSALMSAAFYGNSKLVELMLESPKVVASTVAATAAGYSDEGRNAISIAARLGNVKVVEAFLGSPKVTTAMIEARDSEGRNALMCAAQSANTRHRNKNFTTTVATGRQAYSTTVTEADRKQKGISQHAATLRAFLDSPKVRVRLGPVSGREVLFL